MINEKMKLGKPLIRTRPVIYVPGAVYRSFDEYLAANHQPQPHSTGKFRHQFYVDNIFRMFHLFFWNPSGIVTSIEIGTGQHLQRREANVFPLHREDDNQLVDIADMGMFRAPYERTAIIKALFSGMTFQHLAIPSVNIGVPLTIEGDGHYDEMLIAGIEPDL